MTPPPPAIVRRVPKGGTRSHRRIKAQIKYISRGGEVAVYGSSRYSSGPLSQRDIDDTLRDWVEGTGHFTPGQGEARAARDLTTHLVLSFPEYTQDGEWITEDQVRRIGLRWMRRLFNSAGGDRSRDGAVRFDYLAALHTDTDHHHFHVIVNRRGHGDNGMWLSIANQPRPRSSPRSIALSYTELRRVLQEESARENIVLDARAFPTVTPLIIDPDERPAIYPPDAPPPWPYPVPTLPERDVDYDAYLEDGDDSDGDNDSDDDDDNDDGVEARPRATADRRRTGTPFRGGRDDDEGGAAGPSGLTAAQRAADLRALRALSPADAGPSDPTRGRKRPPDDDLPGPPGEKRQRTAEATPERPASPTGDPAARSRSATTTTTEPADAIALSGGTPGGSATANGSDSVRSSPSARSEGVGTTRKRQAASVPDGQPPAKRTADRDMREAPQQPSSDPEPGAAAPADADMPAADTLASPTRSASAVPEQRDEGSGRSTPSDGGMGANGSPLTAADETAPAQAAATSSARDAAPALRRRARRTQLELLLSDRRQDELRPTRLRPRRDRAGPAGQNRQDDGHGR